ncbi:hypothetical protein PS2_026461 [Malus domestica]
MTKSTALTRRVVKLINSESSNSKINESDEEAFVCEICVESKAASESFIKNCRNCSHTYCTDCIVEYVGSKLQENITRIRYSDPDCKSGMLEPEHCRLILI